MAAQPTVSSAARTSAGSSVSSGGSSTGTDTSWTTEEELCEDHEIEHVRALQSELVQIVEKSEAATGGSEENSPLTRKEIAREVIRCYKSTYVVKDDGVEFGMRWQRFLVRLQDSENRYFETVDLKMLEDMMECLFAYDIGRDERKELAGTAAGLDSLTIGRTMDHPTSSS